MEPVGGVTRPGRAATSGAAAWLAGAAFAVGVAALVVAVAIVVEVHRQNAMARFNAALASVWQLRAEWNGDEMLEARAGAAAALLERRDADDVDAVLDFFDEVAYLTRRGGLDPDLVWYQFYWPLVHYWAAARGRAARVRESDPAAWEEIDALVEQLRVIEGRKRGRPDPAPVPGEAEIRDFLHQERDGGPCAPDDGRHTLL